MAAGIRFLSKPWYFLNQLKTNFSRVLVGLSRHSGRAALLHGWKIGGDELI